jgi:hypothetical protein
VWSGKINKYRVSITPRYARNKMSRFKYSDRAPDRTVGKPAGRDKSNDIRVLGLIFCIDCVNLILQVLCSKLELYSLYATCAISFSRWANGWAVGCSVTARQLWDGEARQLDRGGCRRYRSRWE